uniref:Uncharacterized protein n=1 Tax=Rhizophora mucronata TaxID=61149 RepID=A0A2P2PJ85_RHIMU
MLIVMVSNAARQALAYLSPCPQICTGSLQGQKMGSSHDVFSLLWSSRGE